MHNCNLEGVQDCSSSAECEAPLVCDVTGTQTCVACTQEEPAACTGTTPVCGGDHLCHGCIAHAECPGSDVCLPDGACADADQVAYVEPAPGGSNNPSCTQAMPCTKVASALQTGRPYVKITGTNDEGSTITIEDRNVALLGGRDAKLYRTFMGSQVEVKGTSEVLIQDLEINGALGAQGAGISMPMSNTAKLTLQRVDLINHIGDGILAEGGTLTVDRSTIAANTGSGLDIVGCTLAVSRSIVSGNAASGLDVVGGTVTLSQSTLSNNADGGVSMVYAAFDLTNNFIVGNGGRPNAFGGVRFEQPNADMRKFDFNTVANNSGMVGLATGVACIGVSPPMTLSSNIVYGNQVAGGSTQVGGANCSWVYSDIGPDTVAGTGNINMNPLFIDLAQNDLHLRAASPAMDAADPAASLAIDIEGDPRPQGEARDMGADEVR